MPKIENMEINNIIGKNLKRVRLLKNLSLNDAGKLLNMSATAIAKYENGEISIDSKKIIDFANAYSVKTTYLLKSYKMPEIKFSSFRKKKRLTGQNLDLLKELIQIEIEKYIEVLELNNISYNHSINFKKHLCTSMLDAENAANKFREYIKISDKQPISDLINILENLGFIIIQIPNINNKFDDFDGLCEVVSGYPIIVLLDNINDGGRQRFTISHELGHLLLNIKNSEIDEEKLCHRFASAFLMPKNATINEFGPIRNAISLYELSVFKNEFKVSYPAILYRLKDLNVINDYLYRKLSIYINSKVLKKGKDPFPVKPEKSFQFERLVYKLQSNDIISVNKACELLGVSIDEYDKKNIII